MLTALAELVDARRARGRSAKTIDYIETKGRHLVRLLGGETVIGALTPKDFNGYISARRAEGAQQPTIAKELGIARAALRLQARLGCFDRDPSLLLPEGYSARSAPRTRWLEVAEVVNVLSKLQAHRAAWVALAIASGGRKSEVEAIRRDEIDLPNRLMRISGTKTKDATAVVAIPPQMVPLVELALRHGNGANGLLVSHWGNVDRDLKAACRRAGVAAASPNDLRRTHGTWLHRDGVEADLVAQQLRHTDTKMVERHYARLSPAQARDVIERRVQGYVGGTVAALQSATPAKPRGKMASDSRLRSPALYPAELWARARGKTAQSQGYAAGNASSRCIVAASILSTESARVHGSGYTRGTLDPRELERLSRDLTAVVGGFDELEAALDAMALAEAR